MSDARFEESGYGGPLLEVTDLKTSFSTDRGVVRAVDGVSLTLERGKTLGIVGESGSGKTVLSRSIMNLLPKRGLQREGSVKFEGTEIIELPADAMRRYWGAQLSMIFQDPMTSLNPVMKIGNQITEAIREHLDVTVDYAQDLAESLLASVRHPRARRRACTSTRTSCRAACASGSASPSRSPAARSCSSPTSPRPAST